MREIKFRAWVSGEAIKHPFMDYEVYISKDGKYMDMERFEHTGDEDFPIMQYTGLKDKNGKEIYIGDIVNAIAKEEYKEHTIISDIVENERDSMTCVVRGSKEYSNGLHILWGGWKSIEVIGNIYENPELISND